MKTKTLYTCEICGADYADKRDAQECEKSHKKIKEVRGVEYRSMGEIPDGRPLKILVIFEDGGFQEYRR